MNKRHRVWIGIGTVAVAAVAIALRVLSQPPDFAAAAPAIGENETVAMLAALKPPKRQRPVIAVIGINDATETTDYVMPTGILRRADVADVLMVATGPGRVALYPAQLSSRTRQLRSSRRVIRTAPTTSSSLQ